MSLPSLSDYQQKFQQSHGDGARLHQLAKELIPYFDSQEKVLEVSRKGFEASETLQLAKGICKEVKQLNHHSQPPCLIELKLRVASLSYRMGLKPLASGQQPLKDEIGSAVLKWKGSMHLFLRKELTEKDRAKVEQLSCYPKFAKHLIKDKKMLNECLKLIFRDHFPIRQLVEYLNTCAIDLRKVFIAPRIGFYANQGIEFLKIVEEPTSDETYTKDLQLFINRRFVSILAGNESLIDCGKGPLTWGEVKKMWAESSVKPAQLEFFHDRGMIVCAPQGMVYPEGKIDTRQPFWWKDPTLPVFLTLSKEKLEEKYAMEITEEKPCLATVEASCMDPESVDDAHGACTFYIPNEEGTVYRAYPMGKYATNFPEGIGETVNFLCNSVEASLTYPDPTPFYTQRLHGEAPVALTREEAQKMLEHLGKEVWFFQVTGNNCASEHQLMFEAILGKRAQNYFKVHISEVKHTAPGTGIFTLINQLPNFISHPLQHGLHLLLGSKRKIERKDEQGNVIAVQSLYEHDFRTTQEIYVPGMLVKRILTGEIKGITWYGYE